MSGAFSFGGTTPAAPAPSTGLFFGASSTPAGAAPGPAPSFSFGGATPAAAATPQQSASGAAFSFGGGGGAGTTTAATTPAPFGGAKPAEASKPTLSFGVSAAAPATAAPLSFGSTTVAGAKTPAPTLTFGGAAATPAPSLTFGATTTGTPAPAAPTLSFGSTGTAAATGATPSFGGATAAAAAPAPAAAPTLSFGATPAPASSAAAPGALTTTSATAVAGVPANLRNKTTEEIIATWKRDLESDLLGFDAQVDRLRNWENEIRAAQREIVEVSEYAERLVIAQQQTERVLSDVRNYQDQLDQTLERVERAVDAQFGLRANNVRGAPVDADQTREQVYDLSIKLETQLSAMLTQLKHLVNQLNQKHDSALADQSSKEIMKILNAHHHSIAYLNAKAATVDQSVNDLELKIVKASSSS